MDELMMYTKCNSEGRPIEYAFGPEWVAMALYMDDTGFPTEEEAVLEWYFKIFRKRNDDSYYVPTIWDKDVEVWMAMHPSKNESRAILEWYNNVYKKEAYHAANSKDQTPEDNPADEQSVCKVSSGPSSKGKEV